MTTPRKSIIAKIPARPMSGRTKKYLHSLILASASAALTFLAFSLSSFITLPKGVKGAVMGLALAVISKTAGYVLSELPTKKPDAPSGS